MAKMVFDWNERQGTDIEASKGETDSVWNAPSHETGGTGEVRRKTVIAASFLV